MRALFIERGAGGVIIPTCTTIYARAYGSSEGFHRVVENVVLFGL